LRVAEIVADIERVFVSGVAIRLAAGRILLRDHFRRLRRGFAVRRWSGAGIGRWRRLGQAEEPIKQFLEDRKIAHILDQGAA